MMKFFKASLSILFLSLSLLSTTYALTDMNAKPVKLEQLITQGKWTAVNLWASSCSICRRTAHHLVDIQTSLPNVKLYGISLDDQDGRANAQRFIQEHQLDFPNFLSNAAEMDAYLYKHAGETLMGTPTMLLYSPQGKLVAVQPGAVTADELQTFIKAQ